MNNNDIKIYSVKLKHLDDSIYYMVTDINAIFERKYNSPIDCAYMVKQDVLYYNNFKKTDTNCALYSIAFEINNDSGDIYVIAPSMKIAYETIKKEYGDNALITFISSYGPINYIKSFREEDIEVENMRIG